MERFCFTEKAHQTYMLIRFKSFETPSCRLVLKMEVWCSRLIETNDDFDKTITCWQDCCWWKLNWIHWKSSFKNEWSNWSANDSEIELTRSLY